MAKAEPETVKETSVCKEESPTARRPHSPRTSLQQGPSEAQGETPASVPAHDVAGTTGPDVDAGLANGFTASRLIVRPLALVALSPIFRIGSLRAPCVLVQSGIPSYEGPRGHILPRYGQIQRLQSLIFLKRCKS